MGGRNMTTKQNLVINGSGSYGGGAYHKINIRGEGTITSDFECDIFHTFGTSSVLKNGIADKFSIFGTTEIGGNLVCKEMKVFGTTEIGGTARVQKAKVFGTLEVNSRFAGDDATIKGSLAVKGDTDFERFRSTGSFDIKGLLNAGTIDVSLRYGTSSANEIGGERITVKKKSSFFPFTKSEGVLEANIIEGDDIYLENTKAEIVRGKRIQIGAGCEIALVEYQDSFKAESTASVKENRKIK
jgi:cytoskeletal protein CcmA (bactofilin family)